MTPSEKAKDLVHTFYYKLPNNGYLNEGINSANSRYNEAMMCALVTVNELMKETCKNSELKDPCFQETRIDYYIQTKEEINKLYDNRNTTENPIGNG